MGDYNSNHNFIESVVVFWQVFTFPNPVIVNHQHFNRFVSRVLHHIKQVTSKVLYEGGGKKMSASMNCFAFDTQILEKMTDNDSN